MPSRWLRCSSCAEVYRAASEPDKDVCLLCGTEGCMNGPYTAEEISAEYGYFLPALDGLLPVEGQPEGEGP